MSFKIKHFILVYHIKFPESHLSSKAYPGHTYRLKQVYITQNATWIHFKRQKKACSAWNNFQWRLFSHLNSHLTSQIVHQAKMHYLISWHISQSNQSQESKCFAAPRLCETGSGNLWEIRCLPDQLCSKSSFNHLSVKKSCAVSRNTSALLCKKEF